MSDDIKLKDYFQLGNHESQNTFVVDEDGEETPAISLNEFYEESKPKSGTDRVVTGIEEYQNKTLSRQTASFFSLTNADAFSKHPSSMNYVMGNEGFISSVLTGLKELIERIVKFIMGGVRWLIESGKALLGLSANTERREKQAKDAVNIQKDMTTYLRSVGFPEQLLNIENFMEHLSPNYTEAFKSIQCDMANSKTHLETLSDTVSALADLQKDLSKRSIFVSKAHEKIKINIGKTYTNLKMGKNVDTTAYRDIGAAISEGILELDFKRFESKAMAIVERHYKKAADEIKEIKNPEFAAGVNSLRTAIESIKSKMTAAHPTDLARNGLKVLNTSASSRVKPPVPIYPMEGLMSIKLGSGNETATQLEYIESSVSGDVRVITKLYLSYVSEVAKYVTMTKEINELLQRCISEQQLYYSFVIKLNVGVVTFLTEGAEAFAAHITANNSNLPEEKRMVSAGKHLFVSDDVANSFTSQMNSVLETLHNSGDLLKVKSRLAAFKKQMEF